MINRLPSVRGRLKENAPLSTTSWFRVGGSAEILFKPEDVEDLQDFLAHCPADIPVMPIGVTSNLLIRDGGIEGVVVRLGKGFTTLDIQSHVVRTGAGNLDLNVALACQKAGIGGLEFLSGIPGTIGGALRMNAGAYGRDISDLLLCARVVDRRGCLHVLTLDDLHYSYRHCAIPEDWIFVDCELQGVKADRSVIAKNIADIQAARAMTQPIRARTGGSTFKNPDGHKAWELIDAAGCRGLQQGDAQMSEKHCNFMINTGAATAADLETLGETVRKKVLEQRGISLNWEIRRVGKI